MFFLLMYTYNLFRSELLCRGVKIKSSFLMCCKNKDCRVLFLVSLETALAVGDFL